MPTSPGTSEMLGSWKRPPQSSRIWYLNRYRYLTFEWGLFSGSCNELWNMRRSALEPGWNRYWTATITRLTLDKVQWKNYTSLMQDIVNCLRCGGFVHTLFQQLAVPTSYGDGFSLCWNFFIISVFKISGDSWNLTNSKLIIENKIV